VAGSEIEAHAMGIIGKELKSQLDRYQTIRSVNLYLSAVLDRRVTNGGLFAWTNQRKRPRPGALKSSSLVM
jgi:hypothetical protein